MSVRLTDQPGCVYLNGEFVPAGEAKISVFDAGLISGHMVFDALSAWQGWIFKLDTHIDRFYRSAHAVRIEIPHSKEEFREILVETVRRSGLRDSFIECLVTRGASSATPPFTSHQTVIIFAIPYRSMVSPAKIETGVSAIFSRTRNIPFQCIDPKIKNSNRLHSYMALLEAVDAGVDESIMLDMDGHVTEARGANVFAVKDGILYTPGEGILHGITRLAVLEIAQDKGIETVASPMTPYDFYTADEAFFASTAGGTMPIIQLDGRQVGDGQVGPMSRLIKDAYWHRHVNAPWSTPVLV